MKRLLFLLVIFHSFIFSATLPFLFDAHFSPHASAPGLLSTHQHLTHWVISSKPYEAYQSKFKPFDHHSASTIKAIKKGALSFLGSSFLRGLELYGIWIPLSNLYSEIQYEVFGYGYRLRTFRNFSGQDKHFKFYGLNSKRARIQALFENSHILSRHNRLLLSLSGYEAHSILSHELTLHALKEGLMEPRLSPLYLQSKLSLYSAILATKKVRDLYFQSLHLKRHDWAHYFSELCAFYPTKRSSNSLLKQIRFRASLSLFLDPIIYSSLASQMMYCLLASSMHLPKTLFLPYYALCLSPFGPQEIFGAYFVSSNLSASHFYAKKSFFFHQKIENLGFENRALIKFKNASLGMRVDVWRQPKFLTMDSFIQSEKHYIELLQEQEDLNLLPKTPFTKEQLTLFWGGAFSLIYEWRLMKKSLQILYIQLGYKFAGYLPGESTSASPLLRLGLHFSY